MTVPSLVVLGAGGQVGRAVLRRAAAAGKPVFGLSHRELDLLDRRAVAEVLSRIDSPAVVNAAAFTAIDRAEAEPGTAFRVNRDGAGWVAEICARQGRTMIHLSTDHVFDGAKGQPYAPDDPVAPLNVYGASMAAGEAVVRAASASHIVLRTAWIHAPWGRNFVRSVIDMVRCGRSVRVVDDQQGSPTSADDVARCILLLAKRLPDAALGGVYHWAGRGVATRYEVADAATRALAEAGGPAVRLEPAEFAGRPAVALRPPYSALESHELSRLLGSSPEPWRAGVAATVRGLVDNIGARMLETVS